jgi:hypothetical protein
MFSAGQRSAGQIGEYRVRHSTVARESNFQKANPSWRMLELIV